MMTSKKTKPTRVKRRQPRPLWQQDITDLERRAQIDLGQLVNYILAGKKKQSITNANKVLQALHDIMDLAERQK